MWQLRVLLHHLSACLLQLMNRRIHDREFEFFSQLSDETGLVLDLGASHGHAAVSILSQTRRLRVHSLEPIKWLAPCLWLVRLRHPGRFSFRSLAADRVTGFDTLLVPVDRSGALSPRSSLEADEFDKQYVRAALDKASANSGGWQLKRLQVPTVRVDELDLAPDLVKLDVEGAEARTLSGMQRTLDQWRPALLVEINNAGQWLAQMQNRGYEAWRYSPESGFTAYSAGDSALNLLLLHPDSPSALSRRLHALTRSKPPPGAG